MSHWYRGRPVPTRLFIIAIGFQVLRSILRDGELLQACASKISQKIMPIREADRLSKNYFNGSQHNCGFKNSNTGDIHKTYCPTTCLGTIEFHGGGTGYQRMCNKLLNIYICDRAYGMHIFVQSVYVR